MNGCKSLNSPAFFEELRAGVDLSSLELDNNFTVWQHRFAVDWPGQPHRLLLTAEAPLDYFVLYCRGMLKFFAPSPCVNAATG